MSAGFSSPATPCATSLRTARRTFADEVPVLYSVKVDWEDRIWVARRGPTGDDDGPTDIVTPDGDYIGTLPPEWLRTPDAFGPGGLMAYIESDDLDVPTVRVVRLIALEIPWVDGRVQPGWPHPP